MIRTLLAALALWTAPLAAQVCTQPIVQTGTGYVVRVDGDSVAAYAAQIDAANFALVLKTATPTKRVTVHAPPAWEVACVPAPPPPPPPPPPSPPTENILFFDRFAGGQKAPPQNGVAWGQINVDPRGSAVGVMADPGSVTGYALGLTYGASPNPNTDSRLEQWFTLGREREVFVCMEWAVPANYYHRSVSPANNKILRLWDKEYGNSTVHVGMSLLPNADGTSKMIVEYRPTGGATGNYGTGPWNLPGNVPAFKANSVQRVGFYAKVASGVGVKDGVIRVWWNGAKIYDHADLPLMNTPPAGGGNYFQNGYLPGWSNSGFAQATRLLLRRFVVARQPVAC